MKCLLGTKSAGGDSPGPTLKPPVSERYHSKLPKDDFRIKYSEALDLIMVSIHTRVAQPSFMAFSRI